MSVAVACVVFAVAATPPVAQRVYLGLPTLPALLAVILWTVALALAVVAGLLVHFRRHVHVQWNVALALGVVTVALAGVEAFLRLADVRPGNLALYRRAPHDPRTFRLKPNLDIRTTFAGRAITIRTNTHGMRWREVTVEPGGPARRVAFVGDSFTFGLWADSVAAAFVGVADRELAPLGVEALNFGVPGYGLVEVEAIVRQVVIAFRPSYLVLAFYNGNDFLDTYLGPDRFTVSRRGVLDTDWPFVESMIPPEFRTGRARPRLGDWSRVFGLVRTVGKALWSEASEAASPSTDTATVDRSYMSNIFWSRVVYPEFAARARDLSLATLARIADLAAEHDIRVVLAAIPSVEQVYVPTAFGPGYDPDLPQRLVAESASAHGIAYVDLLPVLRTSAAGGAILYFQQDGHLRNEGHRLVGEHIAAFLRAQIEASMTRAD